MTPIEWDLLRTFAAVARHGSLTATAAALGVSQSTVSRHLARLEDRAGSPLLLRQTPMRLTALGEDLLAAVGPMLDGARAAEALLDDSPAVQGAVTVTTVAEMVRWVLVDGLPTLLERWPHLRLRILADNHNASLAAGEADVALRFARPDSGALIARRVQRMAYGFFVAPTVEPGPETPWLGLTGSLAHIPEQALAERLFAARPARVLVEDVEALARAVGAGLGVAILPRGFARRLGLTAVAPAALGLGTPGLPERELWMVVHRSRHRLPRVRAVMDWLIELFEEAGG